MQCPRGQHENEAGAKLCEECAAPLARACATCGRQLAPTAKLNHIDLGIASALNARRCQARHADADLTGAGSAALDQQSCGKQQHG